MYEDGPEGCTDIVKSLNYSTSQAHLYDPLSQEQTTKEVCDNFIDEIALL